MLTWDDYEVVEFEAEEATGDVLNDALFKRNLDVEERLNIDLTFHEISVRSDYNLFQKTVQQSTMAGSGDYDIVTCETARFAISMLDGMMLDLMEIDYIDIYTAAGLKSVEETDDGRVVLSEDVTSERAVDLMEKMANFFNTQIDAIVTPKYDDTIHFREGRGLFYTYPMGPLAKATYRSLPFNIGFVPMPKYDETEKEYTISSSNAFSLFGIPVDAKDPHMSGAVLECMASEGYRTLIPALFDVCYKVKYNSDESGLQSQVFDLIRENRVFDLGRFFYRVLPYAVVNNFGKNISVNNTAWVSTIEGVRASLDTKLAEITEIMAQIKN